MLRNRMGRLREVARSSRAVDRNQSDDVGQEAVRRRMQESGSRPMREENEVACFQIRARPSFFFVSTQQHHEEFKKPPDRTSSQHRENYTGSLERNRTDPTRAEEESDGTDAAIAGTAGEPRTEPATSRRRISGLISGVATGDSPGSEGCRLSAGVLVSVSPEQPSAGIPFPFPIPMEWGELVLKLGVVVAPFRGGLAYLRRRPPPLATALPPLTTAADDSGLALSLSRSARTGVMAACGYGQINHHEGSRGVAVAIPHSLKILNDTVILVSPIRRRSLEVGLVRWEIFWVDSPGAMISFETRDKLLLIINKPDCEGSEHDGRVRLTISKSILEGRELNKDQFLRGCTVNFGFNRTELEEGGPVPLSSSSPPNSITRSSKNPPIGHHRNTEKIIPEVWNEIGRIRRERRRRATGQTPPSPVQQGSRERNLQLAGDASPLFPVPAGLISGVATGDSPGSEGCRLSAGVLVSVSPEQPSAGIPFPFPIPMEWGELVLKLGVVVAPFRGGLAYLRRRPPPLATALPPLTTAADDSGLALSLSRERMERGSGVVSEMEKKDSRRNFWEIQTDKSINVDVSGEKERKASVSFSLIYLTLKQQASTRHLPAAFRPSVINN
ncbi:hypothetical protein LXL04_031451 [Taraxacum kok-saghyz]